MRDGTFCDTIRFGSISLTAMLGLLGATTIALAGPPPCALPTIQTQAMKPVNAAALDFAREDRDVCMARDATAGTVVTVWSVNQTTGTDDDLFYSRSVDGGQTWSAAGSLNSNGSSDLGSDLLPSIAFGAGVWVCAWESNDSLGGTIGFDNDILYVRSVDGGQTWSAPAALNANAGVDASNDHDRNVRVSTDGRGTWIAAWDSNDPSGGVTGEDQDVFFSKSMDGGLTWSEPALIDATATADSGYDARPIIASDGANQWVAVWHINGLRVFRSDDDGSTWNSATMIDVGQGPQVRSVAGIAGGNWLIAASRGTSEPDIFVYRSVDGGFTWSAAIRVVPDVTVNPNDDYTPWIAFDSSGVATVAWGSDEQFGGGLGFDREIVMCASTDFGLTWGPPTSVNAGVLDSQVEDEEPVTVPLGNGDWLVAWKSTNALNGTIGSDYDVLSARTSVHTNSDCNNNRIPDGCEIISNPTLDRNNDGVLDSCQPEAFPNASLVELIRTGDPAPAGGVLAANFGSPRCARDTEEFIFKGTMLPNIGTAMLLFAGGNNTILVAQGATPPGVPPGVSLTFNSDPFGQHDTNAQQQVVFEGILTGPGVEFENRTGIWMASTSGLTFIARGQLAAPGIPDVTLVTSNNIVQPVIGETGSVALRMDLAGSGVTSTNNSALWRWQAGSLELMVREGDPAPLTGLTFRTSGGGYDFDAAGTLYFAAGLNTAGNPSSVWRVPANQSTPLAIALPGQSLSVLPAGTSLASASVAMVSLNGTLAINGTIAGSGVTTANDGVVLAWHDNNWTLIAREGDAPQGTQGLVWSLLAVKAISPNGKILLVGRSTGSAGIDEAFYLVTPNGLKTVVRTDTPAMGTFPPTFFDPPVTGGYVTAVNDAGDVVLAWDFGVYGWRENYGLFYIASDNASAVIDGVPHPIATADLPTRNGSSAGHSRNLANDGSFVFKASYVEPPLNAWAFIRGTLPPQGDVDGNACVGVQDLLAIIAQWGPCAATPCAGDVTHDGLVNVADLLLVITQWGCG